MIHSASETHLWLAISPKVGPRLRDEGRRADHSVMRTDLLADLTLACHQVVMQREMYITEFASNTKVTARVVCHAL